MTKLTTANAKLKNSQNIVIADLRAFNWFCRMEDIKPQDATPQDVKPKTAVSSVFLDASRVLLINGRLFTESDIYQNLTRKIKKIRHNLARKENFASQEKQNQITEQILREKEQAFKLFLSRELFQREAVKDEVLDYVIKFYNQSLTGTLKQAINSVTAGSGLYVEEKYTANLLRNKDGEVCLRMTMSINLVDPWGSPLPASLSQNDTKLHIPGTVTSEFVLTNDGFKLKYINPSNKLLEDLCLGTTLNLNTLPKRINEAQNQEQINAHKKAQKKDKRQNKQEKNKSMLTILSSFLFAWFSKSKPEKSIFDEANFRVFRDDVKQRSTHLRATQQFSQRLPELPKAKSMMSDREILNNFEKKQNNKTSFFTWGNIVSFFQTKADSKTIDRDKKEIDRTFKR